MEVTYKKLIESLKLLSMPYDEQKTYFPSFVDLPFELSDTYHNAFLLLPQLIEGYMFSYKTIANLLRLENMLNSLNNNLLFKELEDETFLENKEWNLIRIFSREILLTQGESCEKPDSNYI